MERFVLRLASAQREAGHRATILAIQGGPLECEAADLGVSTIVLSARSKAMRIAKGMFNLLRIQPDIVHAHNQTSLHYATLSKRVSKAQVILTNHGQGRGSPRTPSNGEWARTDAIVAVSRAVADRMNDAALAKKTSVILNGVQPVEAKRSRQDVRRELLLGDEPTGIIVARIDGLKGHENLLRALALLPESARLTVLIAGDGHDRERMERLAIELRVDIARVRFLGFRTDVADLLAASDFFLLPSLTEGLPLSVLEAMSCRLPVIATPVGGIPEIMESEKHGLLVPVDDAPALSRALVRMSSDPLFRHRCGDEGYRRVQEMFTFDGMAQNYEDLYHRLCERIDPE